MNPGRRSVTAEGHRLDRFVRAQAGFYPQALAELEAGEKRSHWIWFVFPQIEGLGRSETARLYSISGQEEADFFWHHELLGPRLAESTQAMLRWAGTRTSVQILGVIDALKFQSCMTLFETVAADSDLFSRALDVFENGNRDTNTLDLLQPARQAAS